MKLITEVSRNVQIKQDEQNLYIEGIFSSVDLLNENGRKYKRNVMEREVDKVQPMINDKCLWSELGHPSGPDMNPDRIAGIVESLRWDGNDILGRAKIIDTPMGNISKTLIKEGRVGISSRGLGTVNEKDGYVNDDFNLITWDIVLSPSNNPSWVKGIYEAQEFGVITPVAPVIVEPEVSLDEAKGEYKKHIWQVLTNIEKRI